MHRGEVGIGSQGISDMSLLSRRRLPTVLNRVEECLRILVWAKNLRGTFRITSSYCSGAKIFLKRNRLIGVIIEAAGASWTRTRRSAMDERSIIIGMNLPLVTLLLTSLT